MKKIKKKGEALTDEEKKEKIREIYKRSNNFRAFMEHILHLVEKEDLLNAPYNDLHKWFARFSEFTKDVDYITDLLNFC